MAEYERRSVEEKDKVTSVTKPDGTESLNALSN
jgi:hypothetical protein